MSISYGYDYDSEIDLYISIKSCFLNRSLQYTSQTILMTNMSYAHWTYIMHVRLLATTWLCLCIVASPIRDILFHMPCGMDSLFDTNPDNLYTNKMLEDCVLLCMGQPDCATFNYKATTSSCELFAAPVWSTCMEPVFRNETGAYMERQNYNSADNVVRNVLITKYNKVLLIVQSYNVSANWARNKMP